VVSQVLKVLQAYQVHNVKEDLLEPQVQQVNQEQTEVMEHKVLQALSMQNYVHLIQISKISTS
jgi:hypothetical protein